MYCVSWIEYGKRAVVIANFSEILIWSQKKAGLTLNFKKREVGKVRSLSVVILNFKKV